MRAVGGIIVWAGAVSDASALWRHIRQRRPALAAARRAYLEARDRPSIPPLPPVAEAPAPPEAPAASPVEPVAQEAPFGWHEPQLGWYEPALAGDEPAAPADEQPTQIIPSRGAGADPPRDPVALWPPVPAPGSASDGDAQAARDPEDVFPGVGPSAEVVAVAEPADASAVLLGHTPSRMSRSLQVALPLASIALAAAAMALELVDLSLPVRTIVVLAFVVLGPGWAILQLAGLASGWAGAALVPALSVALAAIVSAAMLYSGAWSPRASLVILVGLTIAASLVTLVRVLTGSSRPAVVV